MGSTESTVHSQSKSGDADTANKNGDITDMLSGDANNTMNVACYNVYWKGFNRKGTIDAICNMKVDILMLQETNSDWERVITNNDIIKSKFKYIQCVNDKYGEGGTIILTKYEIKSLDIIEKYSKWWYGAHRFTLKLAPNNINKEIINNINNKEIILQIYSIHLIAPFPPNNVKQCGCCCCIPSNCCGDSRNIMRLKELKHCLNDKYYDDTLPTLIIGDFNCMDGECHNILQNNFGLKSSWNGVKEHNYWLCCAHSPYSWRGSCHYLCWCAPKLFDHIYYSPNYFGLIQAEVMKIGQSDHYPICAKLKTTF